MGEQHEQRVGQVQSAASSLVRATDKSVACAAIDRGWERGVGDVEVWHIPTPCRARAANLCMATNLFSAINYVPTPFC